MPELVQFARPRMLLSRASQALRSMNGRNSAYALLLSLAPPATSLENPLDANRLTTQRPKLGSTPRSGPTPRYSNPQGGVLLLPAFASGGGGSRPARMTHDIEDSARHSFRRFTVPLVSLALGRQKHNDFQRYLARSGATKEAAFAFMQGLRRRELVRICVFNGLPHERRTRGQLLSLLRGDHEVHRPVVPPAETRRQASAVQVYARGRKFTKTEMEALSKICRRYGNHGITLVSHLACARLKWCQPNSWPKARACRAALAKLIADKHLPPVETLSARRARPYSRPRLQLSKQLQLPVERTSIAGPLRLERATSRSDEAKWNSLVREHHYLGHLVTVGRCMKFFVRDDEGLLAAMSLSDASWKVRIRDRLLGDLKVNHTEVVNNSRFLVLPCVQVKHLASQCLSLLSTVGVKMWSEYYASSIRIIETYVDPQLYNGTCYRAANWIYIGDTRGFSKRGHGHRYTCRPKLHFLYPIGGKLRSALERACAKLHDAESNRQAVGAGP